MNAYTPPGIFDETNYDRWKDCQEITISNEYRILYGIHNPFHFYTIENCKVLTLEATTLNITEQFIRIMDTGR